MATKAVITILISYITTHAHGQFAACMYSTTSGDRCGYCDDWCSTDYASVACLDYIIQEESVDFSSASDCQTYVNAVNGYTSNDMLSCSTGTPRFFRSLVDKAFKFNSTIGGYQVSFRDIQAKINHYIYEKGRDAAEEAVCVALSEGVAAELCESAVFVVALKAINDMFIDPLIEKNVIDGLTKIEDASLKQIAEIADGAAISAHDHAKYNYFKSADEDECDSAAITLLDESRLMSAVVVLLGTFIMFSFSC